jgi:hypothetical protein
MLCPLKTRRQPVRQLSAHHLHRCPGIERCIRSFCDPEEVGPRVNCPYADRSAWPSYDEANGCQKRAGRRCPRPGEDAVRQYERCRRRRESGVRRDGRESQYHQTQSRGSSSTPLNDIGTLQHILPLIALAPSVRMSASSALAGDGRFLLAASTMRTVRQTIDPLRQVSSVRAKVLKG